MIPYLDAITKIKAVAATKKLAVETIDLIQAEGRILAEELCSPEAVPSFDNSSMDGFAVNSQEVKPGVNSFLVLKQIFAGDMPLNVPSGKGVMQIMTGAPMPEGFDAVVKVEDTISRVNERGETVVEFQGPVEKGQFVREIGEDFQKGNSIAKHGTLIDSKILMSAAAVGVSRVSVLKKPRVWVIATGKEIVEYSAEKLSPGEIRNSSSPYLVNELKKMGCEVFDQGIIKDDATEFEACVKAAVSESVDLIISTGAVSMGVHDFVKESIEKHGAHTHFHKVAIRPGRPVLFSEFKRGTAFFGLPGNPISTAVGVQFFVKQYLDTLMNRSSQPIFATLAGDMKKPEGLRCFFKARWWVDSQGKSCVEVLDGQASFMVHSLVKANAWVVLPEALCELKSGMALEVNLQ